MVKKVSYKTRKSHPSSDHYGTSVKLCPFCRLPLCEHGYCLNSDCLYSLIIACTCDKLYSFKNREDIDSG